MEKWNRKYILQIEDKQKKLHTFTENAIDFMISRNTRGKTNNGLISIKNLSENTRYLLLRNRFAPQDYRQCTLSIGYETQPLHVVLKGNVFSCSTTRASVDIITDIEVKDGMELYENGFISQSFAKGTKQQEIVETYVKEAEKYKIERGAIDTFNELTDNSITFHQSFRSCKIDNSNIFIENGTINILKQNTAKKQSMLLINNTSGLLNIPIRYDGYIEVNMIMESSVRLCQIVKLESTIDKSCDGQYMITGIKHTGSIAEQGGIGQCTTMLELQDEFKEVEN